MKLNSSSEPWLVYPLLLPFRTAYQNLSLDPLITPEEIARFAVEYDTNTIAELQQEIEDSPRDECKVVFTGHRGCGKSTLLAKLKRVLEEELFVVFFSISDLVEMSDVNHVNILFSIAMQLMGAADEQNIDLKDSTKKQITRWFAEEVLTESDELKAEISSGFNFPTVFAWFKGQLGTSATVRKDIKLRFEKNISELVQIINQLATVIEEATDKEVVVIIDDIDKLDMATVREIFYTHVKALFLPSLRLVMTVPIAALREGDIFATLQTETNNKVIPMAVLKLISKSAKRQTALQPKPELVELFRELLFKRVDSSLVAPEAVAEIVFYSGGVLRELVRITGKCCQLCLLKVRQQQENTEIKIDSSVVQEAIQELRLDFELPLGAKDFEILQKVYADFIPADPKEQKFLDLLHSLHVLEYRNAEIWYDLHPIIVEILRRKELIPT
ncbi:MAG: AAA family ATPase [Limnothrix sp. RL_2_0]|nr:AAA family ATPase [Limnothrix sp. RL_2_0]